MEPSARSLPAYVDRQIGTHHIETTAGLDQPLTAVNAMNTVNWPAESADNQSTIVGTWPLTSFSLEWLDTKEIARPLNQPTGYLQYSPGDHMVVFGAAGDLRQPATAIYTDAERLDIYKGIIGAYAGTYRIEGNKAIHHVLTAWAPNWIGTDQIRYFEIHEKNLSIKTAPITAVDNGRELVCTLAFVRVE
jgi:Lipocalin-like domain